MDTPAVIFYVNTHGKNATEHFYCSGRAGLDTALSIIGASHLSSKVHEARESMLRQGTYKFTTDSARGRDRIELTANHTA